MKTVYTDFLVIGSGLAGLTYALNVCSHGKTTLICKSELSTTNTAHAQGGIASVLSDKDDFEFHVQDTLIAGDGCCNEQAVRFMISKAPEAIQELIEFGADFTRNCDEIELGLEGGHSRHRIVHAKDETGKEVQTKLLAKLTKQKIEVFEHQLAFELLVSEGRCHGVYAIDLNTGEVMTFVSKVVFLGTGGAGQVFLHTTNPAIATGDGVAMALRAGAQISDMEFIQFHPTCLYDPGNKPFLISEAVRGFGAELKTKSGRAFMKDYHPSGALAPRDIVSRAIVSELEKSGEPCVYLDLSQTDVHKAKECFPNIFKTCIERGINPSKEMIPVVPAAHYICGGVVTDLRGRTSIKGLYAAGEVACTGVHGANRLASNSLLEAAVFSKAAAWDSIEIMQRASFPYQNYYEKIPYIFSINPTDAAEIKKQIRQLMWKYAGIKRKKSGLKHGMEQLADLETKSLDLATHSTFSKDSLELTNLITLSKLILSAALNRKESSGGHYIEETSKHIQLNR